MSLSDAEYLAKLLQGDWKEADNPNTGGKYFYHKKTRESVKTLKPYIDKMRKEDEAAEVKKQQQKWQEATAEPSTKGSTAPAASSVGGSWGASKFRNPKVDDAKGPAAQTTAVPTTIANGDGASSPTPPPAATVAPVALPTPKPAYLPDKDGLAAAALASGDWILTSAYNGEPFYIQQQTRESTGDLGLYLQIQYMLQATDQAAEVAHHPALVIDMERPQRTALEPSASRPLSAEPEFPPGSTLSGSGAGSPSRPSSPTKTRVANPSIAVDLHDWTSVALRGPQSSEAATRLIDTLAKERGGYPSDKLVAELKMANEALVKANEQLATSKKIEASQAAIIEELQKAVYYGSGMGKSVTSRGVRDAALLSTTRGGGVLGHLPSAKANDVFVFDGITSLVAAKAAKESETDKQRIEALEGLVRELQQHNKVLREALNNTKVGKHIANDCGVCEVLDPWKRLMAKTIGHDTFAKSRVDVMERVVDSSSLYHNPLGGLTERSEYRNAHYHLSGKTVAAIEDRSLQKAYPPLVPARTTTGGAGTFSSAAAFDAHAMLHEGRLAPALEPPSSSRQIRETPARAFRSQIGLGIAGAIVPHDYGRTERATVVTDTRTQPTSAYSHIISGTSMVTSGINTPSSAHMRGGDAPSNQSLFTSAQLAKASFYQRRLI